MQILQGDALERLRELPDECVQMCVTSPPFWGLRDYGTAKWEGGNAECDHQISSFRASDKSTLNGGKGVGPTEKIKNDGVPYRDICGKCSAKRIDAQLGLEKTPEEYVAKMVAVFREVRRVLRDNGTLWLNLGDSYVGGNNTNQGGNANFGSQPGRDGMGDTAKSKWDGLPTKNLIGIPWRVAFALQADGWYLRSDIIWAKPNPMPESVTDRPTKSHEYLFLFSKSQRYFYDAAAIAEPVAYSTVVRAGANNSGASRKDNGEARWQCGLTPFQQDRYYSEVSESSGRNKRTVWIVPTAPYPEAHFATYPPDLIKPCILAGSRPGDTVLDPFGGSGTTGAVALELGRQAILIELNPKYITLIESRTNVTPGLHLN